MNLIYILWKLAFSSLFFRFFFSFGGAAAPPPSPRRPGGWGAGRWKTGGRARRTELGKGRGGESSKKKMLAKKKKTPGPHDPINEAKGALDYMKGVYKEKGGLKRRHLCNRVHRQPISLFRPHSGDGETLSQ